MFRHPSPTVAKQTGVITAQHKCKAAAATACPPNLALQLKGLISEYKESKTLEARRSHLISGDETDGRMDEWM